MKKDYIDYNSCRQETYLNVYEIYCEYGNLLENTERTEVIASQAADVWQRYIGLAKGVKATAKGDLYGYVNGCYFEVNYLRPYYFGLENIGDEE